MPITFNCPGCAKGYTVPDAVGGKSTKCRACGAAITIPMAGAQFAPTPMAPMSPAQPPAPARSGRGFSVKKIALVAVAFLVVVALGYGGYALFSGGSSAGMKFMPDNTKILVSVRPADYMKSGVWADIKKDTPDADKFLTDKMKDAPFQMEDISQVLVGVGDYTKEEAVVAIEFKKSVKLEDFIAFIEKKAVNGASKKLTESKVGSYTIQGDKEVSLCQISSNLLIGGSPSAVKAVLERDKKPTFSEGLQKALKDADLSQTVSVAVDIKSFASDQMIGGMAKAAQIDVGAVESAVVNVAVTSDVKVNAIAMCKDAKTAEEYRKMAEGGVLFVKNQMGKNLPKEVLDILESVKIKDKDKQLTAEVALKVAPLISLAKETLFKNVNQQFQPVGQGANQPFHTVGQSIGKTVGGKP